VKINPKITIVMSVHNGEKYLRQQLYSLTIQTYKNWCLLVRNNGSIDSTLKILEEFKSFSGSRKVKIINERKKIEAVYNSFSDLADKVDTKYLMFCDGDDFWLPKKIENAANAIYQMEEKYGIETPLLYHTDLTLVDGELSPRNVSMWKSQVLNPRRTEPIKCLIHNHAIGNTFIINKKLRALAKKRPDDIIMHDVFYLVLALLYGQVSYGNRSYILYRQHNENICGGNQLYSIENLRQKIKVSYIREAIKRKSKLAQWFIEVHGKNMSKRNFKALKEMSHLHEMSWINKRLTLLKHQIFMNGLARNIGLFLFI
jgi:glycosyltransferase involved in cell wall biosynthesis